jgi:hypothetical protein
MPQHVESAKQCVSCLFMEWCHHEHLSQCENNSPGILQGDTFVFFSLVVRPEPQLHSAATGPINPFSLHTPLRPPTCSDYFCLRRDQLDGALAGEEVVVNHTCYDQNDG